MLRNSNSLSIKLRDIDPARERTYFKGVGDMYTGQMKSMNYGEETELDNIFKVDTNSALVNNIRQL